MPSSGQWLKLPVSGDTTTMNSKVVMGISDVNSLYEWVF